MHDGEVIYNAARPIQSWVLDRDTTFKVNVPAADSDHPSQDIDKITYPKGTWMLYSKLRDNELWDKSKRGEYLGWSIGGIATVQQLKQYIMRRKNNDDVS